MLDHRQLRELIIDVLKDIEPEIPYSDSAVELLMLTAAVESNLGTYIKQVNGPAMGIFQMEPATENDIWKNYLVYKPSLKAKVLSLKANQSSVKNEMRWNTAYAIAMARLKYYRSPKVLPSSSKEDLAKMWKEVYNTHLGKGTVEKAIKKYDELVGA